MDVPTSLAIPILLALAGLSVLCALAEASLFSLSRWQVRQMESGGGAGSRAAGLLAHPEDLLSALSLAATLCNGMIVVVSVLLSLARGWPLAWTLVGVFLVLLVFLEILPKTLAVRSPVRWATRTAPAAALLRTLTGPVRWLTRLGVEGLTGWFVGPQAKATPITDEEYRELLDMAVQQGALGHAEREIIAELITLDRRCVRDVMRPRATMAAVSDDLTPAELAEAARRLKYRRLPIYDETPDTIVGVLNTQQFLLDPERGLEEAVEFPSFVPETMNLLQLFQALQRQKRSLAIALDEFGSVAGVVRMEDILTEVLGDMTGEPGSRGFVFEKLGPGRWRVSGAVRLEDFRREYPALPEVPDVETLGGLLLSQLDIVPRSGESAVVHGLKLTATVVDERHIHELRVEANGGR